MSDNKKLRVTMLIELRPDEPRGNPAHQYNKWPLDDHRYFIECELIEAYGIQADIEVTNVEDVTQC